MSRKCQADRILELLAQHVGREVPLPEILKLGVAQYNTRIKELRAEGYEIVNRVEWDGRIKKSWFRLVPKGQQKLFDDAA